MSTPSTLTENITIVLRFGLAYALIGVFFIFNTIALPYPVFGLAKVSVFLIALYYWSVYRPTLIPAWLAFVFGVCMDVLMGVPLGMHPIIFLVVQSQVSLQRRYITSQNFLMIWFGFLLVVCLEQFLKWIVLGVFSSSMFPILPMAIVIALSMGLFPLLYIVLYLTHRVLPAPPVIKNFKMKR